MYENDGFEVLSQLKQVFRNPHSNCQQKMKILTLAPISWSARKIEKFFECSYHMARQAKILVEEKGLMSAQTLSVTGNLLILCCFQKFQFYIDFWFNNVPTYYRSHNSCGNCQSRYIVFYFGRD